MDIAYAFPAMAAEFTPDGKLSMLSGDIDTITVAGFPAINPYLTLVIKLVADQDETGRQHTLRVVLLTPNGAPVGDGVTLRFVPVPRARRSSARAGVGAVVQLLQVRLEAPGEYVFVVSVDERELGRIPLFVEEQTETVRELEERK